MDNNRLNTISSLKLITKRATKKSNENRNYFKAIVTATQGIC